MSLDLAMARFLRLSPIEQQDEVRRLYRLEKQRRYLALHPSAASRRRLVALASSPLAEQVVGLGPCEVRTLAEGPCTHRIDYFWRVRAPWDSGPVLRCTLHAEEALVSAERVAQGWEAPTDYVRGVGYVNRAGERRAA